MFIVINIEIAYALPDKYYLKKLQVEEGTIIQAAIFQSGILQEFTEIDLRENKVGIFSRPAKLTDTVNEGDRIEIYRPLLADPKEIRRKRAEQQQKELEEQKKAEKSAKKLAKQTALSSQQSISSQE
ncbi:RnfH family protein [Haemophilus haemoglobinophilus]|nr:RnfH family protein [Canicola haemoglobinophilus]